MPSSSFSFPFEFLQQIKLEIQNEKKIFDQEKENWISIRNTQGQEERNNLDEQFKITFEQFSDFFYYGG